MNFTVEDAMKDRFREGTTPRSEAYRAGFMEKLHRIIEGADMEPFPFKPGTPEADAYFSGQDHAAEYCKARKDTPLYD
jgi:hypothetical protein